MNKYATQTLPPLRKILRQDYTVSKLNCQYRMKILIMIFTLCSPPPSYKKAKNSTFL